MAGPKMKSVTANTADDKFPAKTVAAKKLETSTRPYRRNRIRALTAGATRALKSVAKKRIRKKKSRNSRKN